MRVQILIQLFNLNNANMRVLLYSKSELWVLIWDNIEFFPDPLGETLVFDIFHRYILVMQRFRVVYYGISHESLVFSRYTHEPLGECVCQENTSDKWVIP